MIIFMLLLAMTMAEKGVEVTQGKLLIKTDTYCQVSNEGITRNYTSGTVPGYWFGLIMYQCGENHGYIISKMDCYDCGMYCIKNDYIEECQNKFLQKVIGVVIGMVISSLIALLSWLGIGKALVEIWHTLIAFLQSRSDRRSNRLASKIELSTMMTAAPVYKNKYNIVKKHGKAYQNRLVPSCPAVYPQSLSQTGTIQAECIPEEVSAPLETIATNDTEVQVLNKPEGNRRGSKVSLGVGNFLIVTISIISLINNTSACDMNFYFKNNGKVCTESTCYDMNMYNFQISYGKLVCFTDSKGKVTKFGISEAIERIRYNHLYSTSNFKVDVTSAWECEGTRDCEKTSCRLNSRHWSFKNITGAGMNGCVTRSSPCDTYCYWSGQCIYYQWVAKPEGSIYKVYGAVSRIWEVVVTMEDSAGIRKVIMNTNNPSVNMVISSIEGENSVPMYVTGVGYEEGTMYSKAVMVGSKLINLQCSEPNLPVGGMVGDYQISIDKKTSVMDTTMVRCQTDNCQTLCIAQEPAIKRMLIDTGKYMKMDVRIVNSGELIVEGFRKIRPTMTIGVGNIDVKNLFVRPARCIVSVAMSFGCVACPIKPYLIFESIDIKSEGILDFESNCTFSRKYLSCSQYPYQIELEENYKSCYIYIPSLNQSFITGIDYKFNGELTPMRTIVGKETFKNIVGSIVTSKPFYETLFHTITGCAIISTIVTVVVKVSRLYVITKTKTEVEGV